MKSMSRQTKMILRLTGIAVAFVFLGLGFLAYRYLKPYDEVSTFIDGLPPDTTFVCLIADSEDGQKVMEWSLKNFAPFSMHPDSCTVSYLRKGETTHQEKVRWTDSNRLGVLRKNYDGEWTVAWFEPPKNELIGRSFFFGGGSVTIDLAAADSHEQLTVDQVRSLGMDYSLTHD